MALVTVVLVAALNLAAGPLQDKPAGRDKVVTLSKERIEQIVQKRKALRSRAETRHKESLARLESARKAFLSKQRATVEEENKKTLERIRQGG